MKSKRKLIITFMKGNWFIAALQSLIFWRKPKNIWTHVQIGFEDDSMDLSAEKEGVVWINRAETLKNVRSYEQYIVDYTCSSEDLYNIMKSYIGKKYDFFFYTRWALNTHLLANGVLSVFALIFGWTWILWLMVGLYTIFNGGMYLLAKDKWACSEVVAAILFPVGIDFGYNKVWHIASPTDERDKIVFAKFEKYK